MSIDPHIDFLNQLDAKRDNLIDRLAGEAFAAERNDLYGQVYEALRLAYTRGYERARIEAGYEATHNPPKPMRTECPACGREIEIRPIH